MRIWRGFPPVFMPVANRARVKCLRFEIKLKPLLFRHITTVLTIDTIGNYKFHPIHQA